MKTRLIGCLILILLLCSPGAFAQTTWVVDLGGGGDFLKIQDCIDAATTGDTCQVEKGKYVENISFLGKRIIVRSSLGPEETIIDGNDNGSVVTFNNGEDEDAVLDGFTITNGSGTSVGSSLGYAGGGIFCRAAPTITNCIISGNRARYNPEPPYYGGLGGGIAFWYANPPTPTVTNCILSGNTAENGFGGGIYSRSTSPVITNCTFTENTAGTRGGGVYVTYSGVPIITNSILWADSASEGPEIGVDWESVPTTLTVSYSDVEDGVASAYVCPGCTLTWGAGNVDGDPLFRDVSDPDPLNWDLHLQSTLSPCVDSGDNSAPELPPTDIDGHDRILDGLCNGVSTVDMGVDEYPRLCDWTTATTISTGRREIRDRKISGVMNWISVLFLPASLLLLVRLRRKRQTNK